MAISLLIPLPGIYFSESSPWKAAGKACVDEFSTSAAEAPYYEPRDVKSMELNKIVSDNEKFNKYLVRELKAG